MRLFHIDIYTATQLSSTIIYPQFTLRWFVNSKAVRERFRQRSWEKRQRRETRHRRWSLRGDNWSGSGIFSFVRRSESIFGIEITLCISFPLFLYLSTHRDSHWKGGKRKHKEEQQHKKKKRNRSSMKRYRAAETEYDGMRLSQQSIRLYRIFFVSDSSSSHSTSQSMSICSTFFPFLTVFH